MEVDKGGPFQTLPPSPGSSSLSRDLPGCSTGPELSRTVCLDQDSPPFFFFLINSYWSIVALQCCEDSCSDRSLLTSLGALGALPGGGSGEEAAAWIPGMRAPRGQLWKPGPSAPS